MGIDNPVHLIFIAAVALIVLGPKRLPDLARSLGQGMREFRDSMSQGAEGADHTTSPTVPQQAQLVAAAEPTVATPPDAVVVDPAAPERPASPEHQAAGAPPVATQAVEQSVPPPSAS